MGWDSRGGEKRQARENASCTAGVPAPCQMSSEPLRHAHAQIHVTKALRMVGGSVCVCARTLASSHDILGQCNKQFMSAHSKDYWCFHWGNIYAPSSSSIFSTLSLQSGRRAGGGVEGETH